MNKNMKQTKEEADEYNKELRELAERTLHKLPAGHYRLGGFGMSIKPFDARTEAAASDKNSTEMASGIISDLRQHNYGNAERNAAILIAQLEQEEQERRKVEARVVDAKPDVFEQAMELRIANIKKAIINGNYSTEAHVQGQLSGSVYALSMHRDYRRREECRQRGML